ncbi:dnaJ homolog subfamily C member 9 [Nilaparvata lugens]|uniref:dnaJ homolog subfamily C member 9 n=1 Tax=Nilaparvata lugens TaxID=108931 RepID=UPI00193CE7C0|nr:dnaJ homolog subfamily C member 9 [Nilaparvata lugens]
MPNLTELCEKFFKCRDFYEILQISRTASEKEVRKAYHKLSLQVHPDRVKDDEKLDATERFKVLGKIHSILSDSEKRAVYNSTGKWEEDDDSDDMETKDWGAYWRSLFREITIEEINSYEKKYKGSDEETADLKRAYMSRQGDMDHILEAVPFTHTEEEPRLRQIIDGLIASGDLPEFPEWNNESPKKKERRRKRWEREAQEAARLEAQHEKQRKRRSSSAVAELNGSLENALLERRKQRESQMDSLLESLTAKYCNPKPKKRSSTRKK